MFDSTFDATTITTSGANIFARAGGSGPPLLLLHGYPETHVMWHRVAPALTENFFVVCADLRGYGDSSKPEAGENFINYSKRAMAADMVEVMQYFGHEQFMVAGHDRGARVTHRLALDHPQRVTRASVMDIAPTLHMFQHTDQSFATGYYHWFFLIQGSGLPEHLIGADPDYFLKMKMGQWSAPDAIFDDEAVAEYLRCFRNPQTIRASCDDYRAAAGIDLEHDEVDRGRRIQCPLLVLWGSRGFVHRTYDVLSVWRDYAEDVQGASLDCGHFLPEEQPDDVVARLKEFFTQ
ncbi:MAG: fluoroacetate dehalogenase [marine bacterium B5-7]|nr:MAG: fluoroacetate dehalogenase [marine bacterium B5-7]